MAGATSVPVNTDAAHLPLGVADVSAATAKGASGTTIGTRRSEDVRRTHPVLAHGDSSSGSCDNVLDRGPSSEVAELGRRVLLQGLAATRGSRCQLVADGGRDVPDATYERGVLVGAASYPAWAPAELRRR